MKSSAADLAHPSRIWSFRPFSQTAADRIRREAGVAPLVARLLAARGLADGSEVAAFFQPALASLHDPMQMRDMEPAVVRLARAVEDREPVAIFGDYDADGLTATALLTRFFRWLGLGATPYIPDRLLDGYGMNREGIDHLRERGVRLIVTVDNGVTCMDEIAYAASLGMDVVVTDHHQPGPELPAAAAIVDPHRADCCYPFKQLSGVGVAFKLAHALARHLDKPADEAKTFLKSLLDLVALGTVADSVPLVGENRVLVYHGLRALQETRMAGLRVMSEMLGLCPETPVSCEKIAFMFAPRLNAAGRTGNARVGLEILLTDDTGRAWELAKQLDDLNRDRRGLENEVLTMALAQIEADSSLLDSPVLVVAGLNWHQGVVGIVASRLADRYARPAIVLGISEEGEGIAKGSARSINGFDIHEALTACEKRLNTFGGHKMAAGLSLFKDALVGFRQCLKEHVEENVDLSELTPRLELDAAAEIGELSFECLEQIETMRPFGTENPPPLVALLDCELADRKQPEELGAKHLKMRLAQPRAAGKETTPITALWFNCPQPRGAIVETIRSAQRLDVAGSARLNVWNGRRTIELGVKDIRPSEKR